MMARQGLVVGVLLLGQSLASAQSVPIFDPVDFVEYWSAARVHLQGRNPYDPQQILPLQEECYPDEERSEPTMLWTPPYTLPLYWTVGALSPREAHLTWLATQALCTSVGCVLIWLAYGGRAHGLWLALPFAIGLFSAPMAWLVIYGQNTGFLLLGLAGFAYCKRRDWHYLAGFFAALTAVKPHFLALFGWVLLLEAYRDTGRKTLFAGISTILVASLIALVPNPTVFEQFFQAITASKHESATTVGGWRLPLLSYQLRILIDPENARAMWMGFLPLGLAVAVTTVYWWKRRDNWDWFAALPALIFGSALLAPYGGWCFDLVVLLFPMMRALVPISGDLRLVLKHWLTVGPVLLLIANRTMFKLHHGWWITPTLLVAYLAFEYIARQASRESLPRREAEPTPSPDFASSSSVSG